MAPSIRLVRGIEWLHFLFGWMDNKNRMTDLLVTVKVGPACQSQSTHRVFFPNAPLPPLPPTHARLPPPSRRPRHLPPLSRRPRAVPAAGLATRAPPRLPSPLALPLPVTAAAAAPISSLRLHQPPPRPRWSRRSTFAMAPQPHPGAASPPYPAAGSPVGRSPPSLAGRRRSAMAHGEGSVSRQGQAGGRWEKGDGSQRRRFGMTASDKFSGMSRFQMRRHHVERIMHVVEGSNPDYFTSKRDCCGKEGLSALQKCVAALRILTYGLLAHAVDEYNVLQRSPVFSNYERGRSSPVDFKVNGNTYNMGYYLADGIYSEWLAFVKTIRHPMEAKTQHFSKMQDSACKDIERAFGVLRARFAIVRGLAYGWHPKQIKEIMMCCIIFHNMIVEDEGEHAGNTNFSNIGLQNKNDHFQLQHDLIEHLWMLLGSNNV
ncbi:hypothetical protein U9M48_025143 [Paspalum notatum var. saurae]|uniref:DDE Tnp4 domain-containing protein n=1 Tax=Paspalum notatum var. saurae TaxID=547442 RepID=A0AAQ3WXN3_PASNO